MTLEVTIAEQLLCCLASVIFGSLAGILYDVFAIFYMTVGIRRKKEHLQKRRFAAAFTVFVFDLLYSVVISISFAVLMYAFSYGKFRVVYLLCSAAGFAAYSLTLGRLIMFLSEKIVNVLKTVIRFILRCICVPFRLALRWILRLFCVLYSVALAPLVARITFKRDQARVERIIREELTNCVKL